MEDKDHIYAVIKGVATNHGGKSNSILAPNAKAQADVIVRALEDAGIEPETLSYIETHGTGTSLGDPIEIEGIKKVFSTWYQKKGRKDASKPNCVLGCVKTNVGHLESASGMASIIKVILAMKHHKIPGNLHLHELNPYIKLNDTNLILPTDTYEWKEQTDDLGRTIPLRAGVSSFGVGGSNAHIIIEDYDAPCYNIQQKSKKIIPISAKNRQES